jgi:DNA-binding MarR family transcriptional regulator
MQLWTAFLRAHRALTAALEAELRVAADMALDEYDVLTQVRQRGAMRMSELADLVLISRPSTTRVVDRLAQRGWLRRAQDEIDRRVVLVKLTPAGRRAQVVAEQRHLAGVNLWVGQPLADHDVGALRQALEALAPSVCSGNDLSAP